MDRRLSGDVEGGFRWRERKEQRRKRKKRKRKRKRQILGCSEELKEIKE